MKVLDIGCGYGSLAKYLAETWDVEVTGLTISRDQAAYANTHFQSDKVQIKLMDYRDLVKKRKHRKDLNGKPDNDGPHTYIGYFDRVVCLEMFEHVGYKNHNQYFDIVRQVMKDDTSLFLLHTIGLNHEWMPKCDPWVNKYIFPNGMLPYYSQIVKETRGKFFLEDWHNMGQDFALTLSAWYDNFERNWPKIRTLLFEKKRLAEQDKRIKIRKTIKKNIVPGTKLNSLKIEDLKNANMANAEEYNIDNDTAHVFFRMWKFYLLFSAGAFKSRRFNLWHLVFSKSGLIGGYESER